VRAKLADDLFKATLVVPMYITSAGSAYVVLLAEVTRPLAFTVTLLYVPTFELTVASVNAVEEPVDPVPVTSPVNVKDPEIDAVEAEVILPFASTVITGTEVEDPYDPAVTPEFARVRVAEAFADPSTDIDPVASPL
jgi:hypothetical protein